MSVAEDITEKADLSWVDMDDEPVCSGIEYVVTGTRKIHTTEECDREAVWSRTTVCCKTTTSLKCDEHKRKTDFCASWTCTVCGRVHSVRENVWRRL